MRRWIALLLLVLLPAQASWATVAAYCMHGAGTAGSAAWHLGHHDKAEHHGHAHAVADEAGDETAQLPDLDCGHCHGQAVVMLAAAPAPLHQAAATAFVSSNTLPCAAPAPQPPERPQWRCFA